MGKRDGAILFLAICMTVLGVIRVFVEGSVETGAWGLSFRQEGSFQISPMEPPVSYICLLNIMRPQRTEPIWILPKQALNF